jgi:uncharacterized membrane protein HdeD (DUF308 family)
MPKSFKASIEYLKFFGEWWSLMSGALSIPFALAALFTQGHSKTYFAILAFVALLVASGGLVKRIVDLKEKLRPKLHVSSVVSVK